MFCIFETPSRLLNTVESEYFLKQKISQSTYKKSGIRETKHLSTNADSSTAAKKHLSIFLSNPTAIAAAAAKGLLRHEEGGGIYI